MSLTGPPVTLACSFQASFLAYYRLVRAEAPCGAKFYLALRCKLYQPFCWLSNCFLTFLRSQTYSRVSPLRGQLGIWCQPAW